MRFWRRSVSAEENLAAARRAREMALKEGDNSHVSFLDREIARIEENIAYSRRLAREDQAGFLRADFNW